MDLPITESDNKHVLVTKWPLIYPMPDQNTYQQKLIVDHLVKDLVPMFGVPEKLLSDRGTNLLSFLYNERHQFLARKSTQRPIILGRMVCMLSNRTLKLKKHVESWGRQLSRPWHGARAIPSVRGYLHGFTPQDGTIQVHLNRVTTVEPLL